MRAISLSGSVWLRQAMLKYDGIASALIAILRNVMHTALLKTATHTELFKMLSVQ